MSTSKRGMTAEDLFKLEFLGEPQISPDGKRVVFVKTVINNDKQYESHLYMQSLEGGEPVAWTFGSVRDSYPRWSPDGSQIAFVSNRSGKQQIWALGTNGGEALQVTNCEFGAKKPNWSPDGKSILFATSIGEEEQKASGKRPMVVERLKYKSDELGFLDHKHSQLAVVDVNSKEVRIITEGPYDHEPGAWSPDGRWIAFTANRGEHQEKTYVTDLYIMSIEDGELRQLTNYSGPFNTPTWSPDGKKIACFGHELEYDTATLNRIWVFNVETGERNCLTAHWDIQAGDVAIGDMRSGHPNSGANWAHDGTGVYFLASQGGNTGLCFVNLAGEVSHVLGGDREIYAYSVNQAKDTFALAIADSLNPGDLYVWADLEEKQLTYLNRPFLEEIDLVQPESITWKAPDGWDLHGWVMKPAGFQEGAKYPLVLEIHGGPHAMYANTFFHEMQVLAAQSYAVLFTNPRGSHGYGQNFVNAVRGDYGGADYRDLMSAVDYATSQFDYIDSTRLGVTGGSYGGFMTNWIVGQTDRFKAGVTARCISNWISFYGVSDIGYYFAEQEVFGNGFSSPEKLWQHSPIRLVPNMKTPLLILHGERDYRCPIEQGEQLFVALKQQNRAPVRFVRFPDSNHELSRSGDPGLRLDRLHEITSWFRKYL